MSSLNDVHSAASGAAAASVSSKRVVQSLRISGTMSPVSRFTSNGEPERSTPPPRPRATFNNYATTGSFTGGSALEASSLTPTLMPTNKVARCPLGGIIRANNVVTPASTLGSARRNGNTPAYTPASQYSQNQDLNNSFPTFAERGNDNPFTQPFHTGTTSSQASPQADEVDQIEEISSPMSSTLTPVDFVNINNSKEGAAFLSVLEQKSAKTRLQIEKLRGEMQAQATAETIPQEKLGGLHSKGRGASSANPDLKLNLGSISKSNPLTRSQSVSKSNLSTETNPNRNVGNNNVYNHVYNAGSDCAPGGGAYVAGDGTLNFHPDMKTEEMLAGIMSQMSSLTASVTLRDDKNSSCGSQDALRMSFMEGQLLSQPSQQADPAGAAASGDAVLTRTVEMEAPANGGGGSSSSQQNVNEHSEYDTNQQAAAVAEVNNDQTQNRPHPLDKNDDDTSQAPVITPAQTDSWTVTPIQAIHQSSPSDHSVTPAPSTPMSSVAQSLSDEHIQDDQIYTTERSSLDNTGEETRMQQDQSHGDGRASNQADSSAPPAGTPQSPPLTDPSLPQGNFNADVQGGNTIFTASNAQNPLGLADGNPESFADLREQTNSLEWMVERLNSNSQVAERVGKRGTKVNPQEPFAKSSSSGNDVSGEESSGNERRRGARRAAAASSSSSSSGANGSYGPSNNTSGNSMGGPGYVPAGTGYAGPGRLVTPLTTQPQATGALVAPTLPTVSLFGSNRVVQAGSSSGSGTNRSANGFQQNAETQSVNSGSEAQQADTPQRGATSGGVLSSRIKPLNASLPDPESFHDFVRKNMSESDVENVHHDPSASSAPQAQQLGDNIVIVNENSAVLQNEETANHHYQLPSNQISPHHASTSGISSHTDATLLPPSAYDYHDLQTQLPHHHQIDRFAHHLSEEIEREPVEEQMPMPMVDDQVPSRKPSNSNKIRKPRISNKQAGSSSGTATPASVRSTGGATPGVTPGVLSRNASLNSSTNQPHVESVEFLATGDYRFNETRARESLQFDADGKVLVVVGSESGDKMIGVDGNHNVKGSFFNDPEPSSTNQPSSGSNVNSPHDLPTRIAHVETALGNLSRHMERQYGKKQNYAEDEMSGSLIEFRRKHAELQAHLQMQKRKLREKGIDGHLETIQGKKDFVAELSNPPKMQIQVRGRGGKLKYNEEVDREHRDDNGRGPRGFGELGEDANGRSSYTTYSSAKANRLKEDASVLNLVDSRVVKLKDWKDNASTHIPRKTRYSLSPTERHIFDSLGSSDQEAYLQGERILSPKEKREKRQGRAISGIAKGRKEGVKDGKKEKKEKKPGKERGSGKTKRRKREKGEKGSNAPIAAPNQFTEIAASDEHSSLTSSKESGAEKKGSPTSPFLTLISRPASPSSTRQSPVEVQTDKVVALSVGSPGRFPQPQQSPDSQNQSPQPYSPGHNKSMAQVSESISQNLTKEMGSMWKSIGYAMGEDGAIVQRNQVSPTQEIKRTQDMQKVDNALSQFREMMQGFQTLGSPSPTANRKEAANNDSATNGTSSRPRPEGPLQFDIHAPSPRLLPISSADDKFFKPHHGHEVKVGEVHFPGESSCAVTRAVAEHARHSDPGPKPIIREYPREESVDVYESHTLHENEDKHDEKKKHGKEAHPDSIRHASSVHDQHAKRIQRAKRIHARQSDVTTTATENENQVKSSGGPAMQLKVRLVSPKAKVVSLVRKKVPERDPQADASVDYQFNHHHHDQHVKGGPFASMDPAKMIRKSSPLAIGKSSAPGARKTSPGGRVWESLPTGDHLQSVKEWEHMKQQLKERLDAESKAAEDELTLIHERVQYHRIKNVAKSAMRGTRGHIKSPLVVPQGNSPKLTYSPALQARTRNLGGSAAGMNPEVFKLLKNIQYLKKHQHDGDYEGPLSPPDGLKVNGRPVDSLVDGTSPNNFVPTIPGTTLALPPSPKMMNSPALRSSPYNLNQNRTRPTAKAAAGGLSAKGISLSAGGFGKKNTGAGKRPPGPMDAAKLSAIAHHGKFELTRAGASAGNDGGEGQSPFAMSRSPSPLLRNKNGNNRVHQTAGSQMTKTLSSPQLRVPRPVLAEPKFRKHPALAAKACAMETKMNMQMNALRERAGKGGIGKLVNADIQLESPPPFQTDEAEAERLIEEAMQKFRENRGGSSTTTTTGNVTEWGHTAERNVVHDADILIQGTSTFSDHFGKAMRSKQADVGRAEAEARMLKQEMADLNAALNSCADELVAPNTTAAKSQVADSQVATAAGGQSQKTGDREEVTGGEWSRNMKINTDAINKAFDPPTANAFDPPLKYAMDKNSKDSSNKDSGDEKQNSNRTVSVRSNMTSATANSNKAVTTAGSIPRFPDLETPNSPFVRPRPTVLPGSTNLGAYDAAGDFIGVRDSDGSLISRTRTNQAVRNVRSGYYDAAGDFVGSNDSNTEGIPGRRSILPRNLLAGNVDDKNNGTDLEVERKNSSVTDLGTGRNLRKNGADAEIERKSGTEPEAEKKNNPDGNRNGESRLSSSTPVSTVTPKLAGIRPGKSKFHRSATITAEDLPADNTDRPSPTIKIMKKDAKDKLSDTDKSDKSGNVKDTDNNKAAGKFKDVQRSPTIGQFADLRGPASPTVNGDGNDSRDGHVKEEAIANGRRTPEIIQDNGTQVRGIAQVESKTAPQLVDMISKGNISNPDMVSKGNVNPDAAGTPADPDIEGTHHFQEESKIPYVDTKMTNVSNSSGLSSSNQNRNGTRNGTRHGGRRDTRMNGSSSVNANRKNNLDIQELPDSEAEAAEHHQEISKLRAQIEQIKRAESAEEKNFASKVKEKKDQLKLEVEEKRAKRDPEVSGHRQSLRDHWQKQQKPQTDSVKSISSITGFGKKGRRSRNASPIREENASPHGPSPSHHHGKITSVRASTTAQNVGAIGSMTTPKPGAIHSPGNKKENAQSSAATGKIGSISPGGRSRGRR